MYKIYQAFCAGFRLCWNGSKRRFLNYIKQIRTQTKTGECLWARKMSGHGNWVQSVSFDGKGLLASGSGDNTIKLWNTKTGECLRTLSGHGGQVWSVSFDGKVPDQVSQIRDDDCHSQPVKNNVVKRVGTRWALLLKQIISRMVFICCEYKYERNRLYLETEFKTFI